MKFPGKLGAAEDNHQCHTAVRLLDTGAAGQQ